MDKKKLAQYLDFANHHQDATPAAIKKLCQRVKEFGFHSAFVNPCYVPLAREALGSGGAVGTVISFPLGQDSREIKVLAAVEAARRRADELDVSMNVGLFKAGEFEAVSDEMKAVVEGAKAIRETTVVKFIIEAGWLTDEEIKKASELVVEAGADFVKTCSGMGPRGSKIRDVQLIKEAIGDRAKIKVAGGVDTYQEAIDFIQAGAGQIGTSHAIEIIQGEKEKGQEEGE